MRIAAGTARGLAYIHHYNPSKSNPKLFHGNIKSTNILLDKSLNPKLADSCLSPLFPSQSRSHHGYRAPEFLVDPRRPCSQKADIYAFGVVLLEILTGKVVTEDVSLPHWVQSVVREEWTSEVFDLELMRYKGVEEEMVGMLQVAMACVAAALEQRPKIGQVLKMIEEIRGEGSPAYESYGETESPCVSEGNGIMAG